MVEEKNVHTFMFTNSWTLPERGHKKLESGIVLGRRRTLETREGGRLQLNLYF